MRPAVQSANLLWVAWQAWMTLLAVEAPELSSRGSAEQWKGTPRQAGRGQNATDPGAMSPHILIVDDDAKLCELLTLYLGANGFRVSTALTATEARELINKTKFRMAILDINLNGESGVDLLDAMKAIDPNVPALMYTGLDVDDNLVQKTLKGRAEGIVRKTESLGSLLTAIQRLV